MTIISSRLKQGELTFGGEVGPPVVAGTSFACQASTVKITPSFDKDGDDVETLCGDSLPAGKKETWTINGTSIQDFDDPEGFLAYCYDNDMETVAFSWQPNKTGAPTWTGECVIVALEEGGDVNTRLTTDWEFDTVGKPTRTPGAAQSTQAEAEEPAEQPAA